MKASIIVPVYNVESYLKTCIDSLMPAVNDSDEILLVQGNSSDNSLSISLEYQERFPQIKVLYQDGKGLSNARNYGLSKSSGDVVLFIDSDDFVDTIVLSNLLNSIRYYPALTDVWVTDFYKYYENGKKTKIVSQFGKLKVSNLDDLLSVLPQYQCFWNVWRNIYRRQFLIDNNLYFLENTYAEDIDFITRLYLCSPVIQSSEKLFYYYRIGRNGSLMNGISQKRVNETITVLEKSVNRLRESDLGKWNRMISGFQFEYLLNMALLQELEPEVRGKSICDFDNYKRVLAPSSNAVIKCLCSVISILGVDSFSKIMQVLKTLKRKREHRVL